MKFDFVVLGATGIQGRIASRDLLENGYSVLLSGRDKSRILSLLKRYSKADFEHADLRHVDHVASIIEKSGADTVLNCAEGDWNLHAAKACIKSRANYLDLGSEIKMTKEQFRLQNIFKRKKLIAITGCGSTPGVNNVMLRYAAEKFDKIRNVDAGFAWNSNKEIFVVPFSIQSIIEEFTDRATVLVNGQFVRVRPREYFMERNFRGIGRQESFFVRHPEVYTFYQFLRRKGIKNIRYFASFPEHSFRMITDLINLGFGSKEEIFIEGKNVAPVNFLTEELKSVEIPKNYKESENLWVRMEGTKNGKRKTMEMNCIVQTLKGWEESTCNIDTGMPASIMSQMVENDSIKEKGSFSPEFVIPPEAMFEELAKRKMGVYENGERIN